MSRVRQTLGAFDKQAHGFKRSVDSYWCYGDQGFTEDHRIKTNNVTRPKVTKMSKVEFFFLLLPNRMDNVIT